MKIRFIFAGIFLLAQAPDAAYSASVGQGGVVSNYGQIQNVQNYSSNPFWNPGSPYNQRMPQPVYLQGADLNTADCIQVVSVLVANFCAAQNNCIGMDLKDVRPTIMTQLSRMPGHNYASSCAGFIDSEFASFVSKYANAGPSAWAAFPDATTPNTNAGGSQFKIQNPYQPAEEDWKRDIKARQQQLRDMENASASKPTLTLADFPETAADYTFTQRAQNKAQGYEPFKDAKVYQTINIEKQEDYDARRDDRERKSTSVGNTKKSVQKKEGKYDATNPTKTDTDTTTELPADTIIITL